MVTNAKLSNETLFRRFLTGDDALMRNGRGSIMTRELDKGAMAVEGYGNCMYALRRPDGRVIIFEGWKVWALDQYPDGQPGSPTTAQHINKLIKLAKQEKDVTYLKSQDTPTTPGGPTLMTDSSQIGDAQWS